MRLPNIGIPDFPWPISVSYLAGAGAFALVAAMVVQWPTPAGVVTAAIVAGLLYASAVDIVAMRLPNLITYIGTPVLLVSAMVSGNETLVDTAAGALIGGGIMAVVAVISRGQVGLGDVKLSVLGGALVGSELVLPALFIGSLSALPICLGLIVTGRISRRQAIPFGPFLSFGFILVTLVSGSVLTR